MEYQKAIKILRYTPVIIDPYVNTTTLEYKKMLDIAEEAIEKQIPKKPIVDPAHLVDFQNYHCPKCKNKIIARIDGKWIAGKLQKYCDNCGQALDWSD